MAVICLANIVSILQSNRIAQQCFYFHNVHSYITHVNDLCRKLHVIFYTAFEMVPIIMITSSVMGSSFYIEHSLCIKPALGCMSMASGLANSPSVITNGPYWGEDKKESFVVMLFHTNVRMWHFVDYSLYH